MLEIANILNNRDYVIAALEKRGVQEVTSKIDLLISLEETRKQSQQQYDNQNSTSKSISNEIEKIIKNQNSGGNLKKLKEEMKKCKEEISRYKNSLNNCSDQIRSILCELPNLPHSSVPFGKTASDNEVIYEKIFIKPNSTTLLPHWELAKKYNLVDFDCGNKITGAGFPVYIGKCAKLQRSLINFLLDEAVAGGYSEVQVPHLINEESAYGTGQLPDMEGQMYEIVNEKMYLVSTAEIPVTNIYRKTILNDNDFPLRIVAYTPCFRREAGSWGADVRGLNRLHQFDKVELVQITKPENSYSEMESMADFLKKVLEKLGIAYRILRLCTGDMGSKSALQYDFEAWSEGQKKWIEISSLSNFETYQSNRMSIKYKDPNNKNQLVHTLNGSCFGIPRMMIAILENFQTSEGIQIPTVLQEYTKFSILS